MNLDPEFSRLLRTTLVALLVCAALVAICYEYVDRPVAFYVHNERINKHEELEQLTYPPPIVQNWAPLVLAALLFRRAWGPFYKGERVLLAAGVGMIVADQFRESLGFAFARYWPETWRDNPSLIGNKVYGFFNWFEPSNNYGSFPSGHTARVLAVVAVLWIAYPQWWWRCVWVLLSLPVPVGLIGMNYHFVSDVIAGAFIGGIVGAYAAEIAGVGAAKPQSDAVVHH